MKRLVVLAVALSLLDACSDTNPVRPELRAVAARASLLIPRTDIAQLTVGERHACVLTADSSIHCWGTNNFNVLDVVPTTGSFLEVHAGGYHNCALLPDRSVRCWADPSWNYGQLENIPSPDETFTLLATSWHSHNSCALTAEGRIRCWGPNGSGQLHPPTDAGFTDIQLGALHICALTGNGSVRCWGDNRLGQLNGTPSGSGFVSLSVAPHNACALTGDGHIACWGSNPSGARPPTSGGFRQVSAGNNYACARAADGSIQCWGSAFDGRLDAPPGTAYVELSAGNFHTCALATDRSIRCWGDNFFGQLEGIPSESGFTNLHASYDFTCALAQDGSTRCWGATGRGEMNDVPGTHVRPTATLDVAAAIDEGSPIALSLVNPQVPGAASDPAFTFAFDCGDGAGYGPFSGSATRSCPTVDDGSRVVRGTVLDRDHDASEYSATVRINNVAPTFGAWGAAPVDKTPHLFAEEGSFSDPGSGDTWTVTVDYGDGSGPQPLAFTPSYSDEGIPGGGRISLRHVYGANGSYTVTITVRDDDNGSAQAIETANISDYPTGYTPPGEDVVVTPTDPTTGAPAPIQVTFPDVTSPGTTTVISNPVGQGGGPPPPANYRLGTPPTYYDIQTTAGYTPPLRVCILV